MVRFILFWDVKVARVAGICKFSCRLIRMHTPQSRSRDFCSRKVWRMRRSVDNEVPKSTAYKTKFSCKVFEEWKQNWLVKSRTLEPGGLFTTKDFEEGNFRHGHYRYVCMESWLLAAEVHLRSKQFSDWEAGSILPVRCTQFFADWSASFLM